MDEDYDGPSGAYGHPEIVINFKQDGKSVGHVSIREFLNSGEVPCSMLPADAVVYWNALEQNIKDRVTAHITLMMM